MAEVISIVAFLMIFYADLTTKVAQQPLMAAHYAHPRLKREVQRPPTAAALLLIALEESLVEAVLMVTYFFYLEPSVKTFYTRIRDIAF